MESFHRDSVFAVILGSILLFTKVQIVLNGPAGVSYFLVLPRRDGRRHSPKGRQDGYGGEDGQEDGGVESTTKLSGQVGRHNNEQADEHIIVEGLAAG